MMKAPVLSILLAALTGCSSPAEQTALGWSVQAPPGPTEALLIVRGPTAAVGEVVSESAKWGWRPIDRADSLAGFTFVLMAGPTELRPNELMMDLLRERGLTFGPAISPERQFQPAG